MSLTQDDMYQIGALFDSKLDSKLEPVFSELKALREDIKEIYAMLSELKSATITDADFKKRSLEKKLLTLNAELLSAAKQAGIVLPRN